MHSFCLAIGTPVRAPVVGRRSCEHPRTSRRQRPGDCGKPRIENEAGGAAAFLGDDALGLPTPLSGCAPPERSLKYSDPEWWTGIRVFSRFRARAVLGVGRTYHEFPFDCVESRFGMLKYTFPRLLRRPQKSMVSSKSRLSTEMLISSSQFPVF